MAKDFPLAMLTKRLPFNQLANQSCIHWEELGTETVHLYQGYEPSGRMFNEIVLDHNGNAIAC